MAKKKPSQGNLNVDVSAELEAYAKIKAAETLAREKLLKEAKVTVITDNSGKAPKTMDFDVWWMDINRRVTLKSWMKEIIKADFKGRGLSSKESLERFDDALRIFGVKF